MRRIAVYFIVCTCTLLTFSTVSFAADKFAYRAGQPYMKSTAAHFGECEAQCRGDAACRGWNFIKPNPRSRSGICEFNARIAAAVANPISISGENSTSIDQVLSRAVPITSGNTVRVGTPIMPIPAVSKRAIRAQQVNTPQRVIKKLPVENVIRAPIPAGYKPITQSRLQPFTGPVIPRPMTRQQIYKEQKVAAQKRTATQEKIQAQSQNQALVNLPAKVQMPQAQYPVNAQIRPAQPIIQRKVQTPPVPIMPIEASSRQSLYGSLHDDLTQNMTTVPRPQAIPDRLNNPDAPIATNRGVPVVPVQAVPLGYPAIAGQRPPSQPVQNQNYPQPQLQQQQIPQQQLSGLAGGH